jgi:hypothetical protein
MTPTEEQLDAAHELMMSETMGCLCSLAVGMDHDFTDPDAMRTALITCAVAVVRALDAGQITCQPGESAAMLHGLLMSAFEAAMPGMLKRGATPMTARVQ